MIDPILLCQQLVQCPSVTPRDEGCLDIIEEHLRSLGFSCHRLPFENVDNLYARIGTAEPNFCFAGHTDVVPPGNLSLWTSPPFDGAILDQKLFGRGVVDMKGAIAAFIAATSQYLSQPLLKGSISFLLTSDEEGPALHGTRRVIDWLNEQGEKISACLVGEPTNPATVGEMVKVGRRGSLNATIKVEGKTGHVAYPELAQNPIPHLLTYLQDLHQTTLDEGYDFFDPTNLEITTVDVGNPTTNVIPSSAEARVNIRFNPNHTGKSLSDFLRQKADTLLVNHSLDIRISGEPFLRPDPFLQNCLTEAIQEVTGKTTIFSTTGGTSDGRFIKDICPVIEFGLVNATAHQIDEHIDVKEIHTLTSIYREVLSRFLAGSVQQAASQ